MKPSINLRYKSLLLTSSLIFSTGVAAPVWGQTYTINYKNGSPQTGITERVDTVYVADGEERELFIPELRNNDGFYNANYRWYVRWYQLNEGNLSCENIKGKAINPKLDGSFVQGGALQDLINLYPSSLRDAGTSLFFYKDFYKIEGTTAINSSVPLGASTVEYSAVNVKEDLVVCDVSLNNNYKVDGTTFTEPTLSIRYKFVIRPASEIANRIKDSKADETTPFMDETIYVPQNNGTINIQLGRIANNYAWYDGDQIVQGETYQYKKDNGEWKDLGNRWTQIINNLITVGTQPVKLEIRAVGKDKTKASPLLVRYNLISGDHGFMLQEKQEKDSDPRRNPDNYPEFYERIGYINFDRNDSISVDDLNSVNNMAKIGFLIIKRIKVNGWIRRSRDMLHLIIKFNQIRIIGFRPYKTNMVCFEQRMWKKYQRIMKRLRERLIFGLQVPKVSPKWQSMTGLITIRGKNHWDISFMWMRPICRDVW